MEAVSAAPGPPAAPPRSAAPPRRWGQLPLLSNPPHRCGLVPQPPATSHTLGCVSTCAENGQLWERLQLLRHYVKYRTSVLCTMFWLGWPHSLEIRPGCAKIVLTLGQGRTTAVAWENPSTHSEPAVSCNRAGSEYSHWVSLAACCGKWYSRVDSRLRKVAHGDVADGRGGNNEW